VKELRCADAGFDCPEVIHGETEDEVMSKAAVHARDAHDTPEIDQETSEQIRSLIHDA